MEKIGKYRVLGKIGQGGMASVYLVEDERIGKRWAVKAISKSTLPKEGILLLKELDHPSLPRIVEELEDNEMYYEVMDFFAGIDLDRWLKMGISHVEAISSARQILESVAYLHGRAVPVIHRDIKPANFIITREGKVKLIDFDLAISGEHSGLTPVGTKGYAPPEQYRGVCTMRGDVYALGKTIELILSSVKRGRGSLLERALVGRLNEMCGTACSAKAEKRFGDAGEMLEAFEKCCRRKKAVRNALCAGLVGILVFILALSGRNVLRDAFGVNAYTRVCNNYTSAKDLLCRSIAENLYDDALNADEYIRSSKHLLEQLEPEQRTELVREYYALHHTALIVSGSTAPSERERTDSFRTCISDDVEYEEFLKKHGNIEDIFKVYSDDAVLCRIIGDDGSAQRFYEKALSMPGIAPADRISIMRFEGKFVLEEDKNEDVSVSE